METLRYFDFALKRVALFSVALKNRMLQHPPAVFRSCV
jgi:hypothetical protein